MVIPVILARKLTYRPGDRLFEHFNDLTVILAALARSMAQVGGSHQDAKSAMRMKPRHYDYAIAIPTFGPLEIAFSGDVPQFIDIGLIDLEEAKREIEGPKVETTGFRNFMVHVVQPIFLAFFERYNVWLTDNLGDGKHWPPTLNFARVVRNAIAHGRINFRDPRVEPVSWKGLSYGYADRGKQIIGTDLGPTDLIGLMIECDEELTKLGVPRL